MSNNMMVLLRVILMSYSCGGGNGVFNSSVLRLVMTLMGVWDNRNSAGMVNGGTFVMMQMDALSC